MCKAVVLALHSDTVLWALHQSKKLQSDTRPDKSNSGDVFLESLTSIGGMTLATAQRCFFDLSRQMIRLTSLINKVKVDIFNMGDSQAMTDLPQKHLSTFEWINEVRGQEREAERGQEQVPRLKCWAEKGIFAACFVWTHRGQSYITGQREHQVVMHCSDWEAKN